MSKQVLVTDSLFIFPEHEQLLEENGFEVVRLDTPSASEDELIEALKNKVGYILGGVEKVTDKVIESAESLKAIVFTGTDYKTLISGWQKAIDKGIVIGNVPDGPSQAVAEWALTAALSMNRGFFDLARPDGKTFMTTKGINNQTVGIIGLGHIGSLIADLLVPLKPKKTIYYSTHHHPEKENKLGIEYTELESLLKTSDIVFLCVPGSVGADFFGDEYIGLMKKGALLVSFLPSKTISADSLYKALKDGKIRAVSDHPMDERFNDLPLSTFFSFVESNAFNSESAIQYTSDRATQTLIDLLGSDQDKSKS